MTALDQRPPATADVASQAVVPPAAAKAPAPQAVRPPVPSGRLTPGRAVALTCALLGVLLLGFVAYLFAFSTVSMDREQTNLRKTLQHQLADALAPVGPTGPGEPVAALDIPALDIHTMVVVEGTSSRDLMSGPGHLPASALPGQTGTSILFGKRSTFGAPFADLGTLKVGDTITATTGLGVAKYTVSSFGNSKDAPPANSQNRLLLYTADSLSWSPSSIIVSADLTSAPIPGGSPRPPVADAEYAGHRDYDGSLIPLLGWSQVLLLLAIGGTVAFSRWPRWPVVLCLGPVLAAVLWSVYENAAGLLPNVL